MKNKKLFMVGALVLSLSVFTVACSGGSETKEPEKEVVQENVETPTEAVELEAAFAEQPILLTSAGQSADADMLKVLVDKGGLEYEMDGVATADALEGKKTLLVAIGGSSKGLGAAGINADDEIARVDALIDAAKEQGISVIAAHIGGEARRGDLSDKFVAPVVEKADYVIVVEDGNKDGLFDDLASKAGIPIAKVATMAEVLEPLQAAFK